MAKRNKPILRVSYEDEVWVEARIERGWTAAYRLLPQQGHPVVAEIRIFPREPSPKLDEDVPFELRAGNWKGSGGGLVPVPPGGITARLLRKVQLSEPRRYTTQALQHWAASFTPEQRQAVLELPGAMVPGSPLLESTLRETEEPPGETESRKRRGRPRLPDAFLASVADDYIRAFERGSPRPVVDTAAKRGFTRSKTRGLLSLARDRKILTEGEHGKRGGSVLTAYGRELLSAQPRRPKRKERKK